MPPASRRWWPTTPAAAARSACHLGDHEGGLADMRRNIDAWWPLVDDAAQVEAIVMNASGCGVTVKEYGHALAHDPAYADKARAHQRADADLSELLPDLVPAAASRKLRPRAGDAPRLPPAVHAAARPAAARRRRGASARARLRRAARRRTKATCAAARPAPTRCCSPSWRTQLRDRKLGAPRRRCSRRPSCRPTSAASSTCRAARTTPVRHWVEVLDEAMAG